MLPAGGVAAQEKFPSRPIELVVPWGPGGGADQLARLTGKLLEPLLGTSVPVVNVPGGTGATGMAKLLAAPADGHSMAIYIADSHALLAVPGGRWQLEDLSAVAVMIKAPSFLFVADASRFKTWAEFESEAKAKPGTLKIATLGFGSVDDFTLKHLEARGNKVVQVPFARPAERYASILGGHADALYEQAGDVGQFLRSKQMRPILMFGSARFKEFPDVPASHELGYKVALPQFRSLVVRAGTPPERIAVLSQALTKVGQDPEFKKFLAEQYADPESFVAADKANAYLKAQLEEMKALVGAN
jgi:tripartite-type tricarboxylate transporter receptor subunit TctC